MNLPPGTMNAFWDKNALVLHREHRLEPSNILANFRHRECKLFAKCLRLRFFMRDTKVGFGRQSTRSVLIMSLPDGKKFSSTNCLSKVKFVWLIRENLRNTSLSLCRVGMSTKVLESGNMPLI
ncbi:hypothetical protein BpHYR1_047086 [Brachionus plicatilis]|uniref:Uncharacterized protein n=1 Tax=Brachionus plicatilis TaxID=10195 RepID=A0A3M7PJL0_BRAPC|nr:hypothetical protein BpHYR1_047086 [Brachionus plicatilis]